MTHSLRRLALFPLLAGVALAFSAQAQTPPADTSRDGLPGKDVFDQRCAACHLHPEFSHAPPVATLRTYPADRINTALTTGVMRAQGSSLSDEERDQVVAYLAAPAAAATSSSTTTTTSSHSTVTTKAPGL